MQYIRVPQGPDYLDRLEQAIAAAPDGATICIPGIGTAIDVENRRRKVCPDKNLETRIESGWEPYQTLPELRAAIQAYDHDTSTPIDLTLSVAMALECEGFDGYENGDDYLYCNETGILVICRPAANTPKEAAAGLMHDGVTGVLFVVPGDRPTDQEDVPMNCDGKPATIVYLPDHTKE